jgi:glutathione synthase/RimK-type ligase-like ATP-grasp enzyme
LGWSTQGGLCTRLVDALAQAEVRSQVMAAPALVQEELVPPELRVYVVGTKLLGFDVASGELDYRKSQSARVTPAAVPAELGRGLLSLARALGLDFAAADFKTDPAGGSLVFLEVNTAPMFAAFDAACGGALTDAIVDWLVVAAL